MHCPSTTHTQVGEYARYCFYIRVSQSWDAAHQHCQRNNAHLWSINSHEEWEILFSYFKDYTNDGADFMEADAVFIGWNPSKVCFSKIF